MKTILICGSRNWKNREVIRQVMLTLSADTVIVEGGAAGADSVAREVAHDLGLPVLEHKALWAQLGKAAGPMRNEQMVKTHPDQVFAFADDLGQSLGTADMVRRALREKIPTFLVNTLGQMRDMDDRPKPRSVIEGL
jgi:hypothetical protein